MSSPVLGALNCGNDIFPIHGEAILAFFPFLKVGYMPLILGEKMWSELPKPNFGVFSLSDLKDCRRCIVSLTQTDTKKLCSFSCV